MIHALVRHKVKDYDEWKKGFDADANNRKSAESKGGHVFRSMDDPNEIFILFEIDTLQKAQGFFYSDKLKQTMKETGVVGKPDIHFLDEGVRFKT
jgi:hypothetical protein